VAQFIESLTDPQQSADSLQLIKLMQAITRAKPKLWAPSIIGFGSVHYRYASGWEDDICLFGFSPRKSALVIYQARGGAKDAALRR
jgi:hypothetical protein